MLNVLERREGVRLVVLQVCAGRDSWRVEVRGLGSWTGGSAGVEGFAKVHVLSCSWWDAVVGIWWGRVNRCYGTRHATP